MAERTPYPERGRAAAPVAPPAEESLYAEMLRYQNENNIADEQDILASNKSPSSRRRRKAGRSRSPQPSSDGTPGGTSGSRATPSSGRRKHHSPSGRRSPTNVTASPSSGKKPGIVAVDQPAIHPNSAMYHAAYNNTTPAPAPAPRVINNAEMVEATPIRLSGSGPVDASPTVRSRTPTRSDAPQASRPHRGKSPKKEGLGSASAHVPRSHAKKSNVIDALCVSAHNPTTRPLLSPMDPQSGTQHNPMFFASVDETLATTSQQTKKTRSKTPMLDALGLSQHKKTKSKPQRSNSVDKNTDLDENPSSPSKKSKTPMLDALGLSQHKKTKSKPQRSNSTDKNTDLDDHLASPGKKSSKSRSKSPKFHGRTRRKSISDEATPPKVNNQTTTRRGSALVEDMPTISPNDVEMPTPGMPVFSETNRRRGSVGAKSDPSQTQTNTRRRGSVGAKSDPSQTQNRTKTPPRNARSPTRNTTPEQTKKKPPPGENLAARAATTGSSNVPPTSSSAQHQQQHSSTPNQVERASSDPQPTTTSRFGRRTSTPQEQLEADLMLALQLSQQDAQGAAASSAPSPPTPSVARAPSPKPPPSAAAAAAAPAPVAAAPKPAKKSQPIGLGDHFARSEFAQDATKRVATSEDESSLADVLLALKISAEEEAARKRGEVGGGGPSYNEQRMTSIHELLELEANDRRRSGATDSDVDDDDDDEKLGGSSVMDLVAAGISAQHGGGGDSNNNSGSHDATRQQDEYERIRQEEQRQLEMALKASEEAVYSNHHHHHSPPSSTQKNQVDDDLRMALEASRDELDISNDEEFMREQQRAMEQFAAQKTQKKQAPLDHERGRNSLVERGTAETQRAITAGKAHIVTCRGCRAQLQAPIAYSLVFCPNCQTVSPTGM